MVKVSVIIPIYNVEKYIEDCICSVLKQTLREIEIICVNDGTKDNSMSIVDKYKEQDDRIIIVNKENGGLSSARNAGLDCATGEYVYFLDSDDMIADNMLESLYNLASKDDLDNIYFDAEAIYESSEVEKQYPQYKTYYCRPGIFAEVQSGPELFARMENFKYYRPSACLQMPKRSLLDKNNIRFKEGIIHEDQLFSIQVILLSERAKHIAIPYYMRRVRSESIMTSEQEFRSSYGYYICLKEYQEFLKQFNFQYPDVIKAVRRRLQILQNLAVSEIHKLSCQELKKEIQEYPLDIQFGYELYVIRVLQERQSQQDKQKKLKKEIKDVKKSTTFRIGRLLLLAPRKCVALMRNVSEKGISCTWYAIKRRLTKERRELSPNKICVSIIIPIYNAEKYLRGCLNQLRVQTLESIEIICVNDGSTDETKAILDEYAVKDSRIKVIHQDNQGAGIARNKGLEIAQGEYLLFLDADDIFDKKLCEDAYYKAKYDMADVVLFGANRLNMQTAEQESMGWVLKEQMLPKKMPFSIKDYGDKIYQVTTACPWSKMFRAEFVRQQQLQFQNTKNANDVFFVRTALATAKRITVLRKKKYITYRYNDGSNIQSGKNKAPIEFYKAFKALKEELLRRGIYKKVEQSYVNMVMKESLFNLRTVSDEAAKQVICDTLWNEGFSFFEFSKYDKSYFYDKKEYAEYQELLQQRTDL